MLAYFRCLFFFFFFPSVLVAQTNSFPQINPENITIIRDNWGVPHIYAPTDAEVAYGLAWAHAEDDFHTIQEPLLAVRGELSKIQGKDGALMDAVCFLVDARKVVNEQYDTTFSPQFKKVLNGYVQGINAYAKAHPKEILLKNTFPVTEKDIITGYVMTMTFMTNVHYDLIRIFDNTISNQEIATHGRGSNAIVLSPKKSKDGSTFLVANSHQPLRGMAAWYEVHLNSEEGWNFLGGTFAGGVTPFLGTNEHLGWAHTVNYADFHDVYQLEMHPKNKLQYRYDGMWKTLEKKVLKLKVKVGPIRIPIKRTFYQSVYGPTIKNKDGFYALRFPSNMRIGGAEQWYHMNKSTSYEEFMEAMELQELPNNNTLYADKEGNIMFLGNGLFADRNPNYNWGDLVLPGDTSATFWSADTFMPMDSLILLKNPACGYFFNMNHTPFNCTCEAENPAPSDFNPTIGYLRGNTARSLQFMDLMEDYDKMSYADLKKVKYDSKFTFPLYTHTIENLDLIRHLDAIKYPDIADVIQKITAWDGSTDVENREASIMSLAIQFILQKLLKDGTIDKRNNPSEKVYADALRFAKKHLLKHFGTIDIPLGKLQVHVRGDQSFGIWGLPDVLTTMYTEAYKDGTYQSFMGESYILLATYKDGQVSNIETINCYGASNRPDSPHYTDQMELFVNKKLKPMSLDRKVVEEHAVRVYYPGE